MRIINRISRGIRNHSPVLWQRLKYLQYIRSPHREKEIDIVRQFLSRDRRTIDIGVHFGFYTYHFSRFSHSVVGFEANPESALFAARVLDGVARIEPVGLSSVAGNAVLRIPLEGAGGAEDALGTVHQENPLGGAATRAVPISVQTLDSFGFDDVGFIKIDVEGHEEEVLKGAVETINRCRPAFMIEIEERHNAGGLDRIKMFFAERGYRASFYDGTSMVDISTVSTPASESARGQFINNYFFVPQ